jgi:hypothetical protein
VLKLLHVQPVSDYTEVFENVRSAEFPLLQDGVWAAVAGVKVPVVARSQALAIESYTGKGEGAVPGQFRAVAWSAWKGTVTVDEPLQVLEDRRKDDVDG